MFVIIQKSKIYHFFFSKMLVFSKIIFNINNIIIHIQPVLYTVIYK